MKNNKRNVTPAVYIELTKKAYYNVMRYKKREGIRGKRKAINRMLESVGDIE